MRLSAVLFLSLSLLLVSCARIQAQNSFITTKDAPEKVKDAFKAAYAEFTANDFEKCLRSLEKIVKKTPNFVNAYYVMADCYIQQKNWPKAIELLNRSATLAPDNDPGVYYTLGQIAMEQEQYVDARKHLEKFLTYPSKSEARDRMAKKSLSDAKFRPEALSKPVKFEPKNMGENINSEQREYFPSVTADENTLIYTVQIGEGQRGQEDLYRSLRKDNAWTKAEPLPNVNTAENEGAQSVSADGKFLVFTVCNREGDYGSCDLYYSERVNGKWSKPKNIGAPINTNNWESQPSVAPNGDAIYFTRGGARGQGDKNLMVSRRKPDGTWAEPEALHILNTSFNEGSPCIHPDGQTLYFSSDGHPGMGSLDLFMSRLQPDGSWGTPQNLGYPINTAQAEEALAVTLSGELAFIASDRPGGFGSLDIYNFVMPEGYRPQPVTYVKGLVYDADTKKPLPGTVVEMVDLATNKVYALSKTDGDGEFLVCLPMDKDYALNVNRPKYIFYSDNFALKAVRNLRDPFVLKIPLQPVTEPVVQNGGIDKKESEPIVLKNVFFATNSAELRPESKNELDKLKQLLDDNPKMRIRLNGHTDNEGNDDDNLSLSDRRANAVRTYLINKGIVTDRLEAKGFGETKPVATNDTPDGRQQNRRTEFVVLN